MNQKICSDLGVAILAGGSSSRFGADKAQFRLDPNGPTLLESVLAIARQLSTEVFIVGHEKYRPIADEIPIIHDDAPGNGPLPAIEMSLRRTSLPRVLVLACDMPCLSVPLLTWMIEMPTAADAVVPRTLDRRWHPLHAIYRPSCLPAIRASMERGSWSASAFYSDIVVQTLAEQEIREIDPELHSLFSLNSRDQLDSARQCASGR